MIGADDSKMYILNDVDRAALGTTNQLYTIPQSLYSDISGGLRGGAWAIRSPDNRVTFNPDVTNDRTGWVTVADDLDVGTIRKVVSGFYSVIAINTDGRVFVRVGLGGEKNPGGAAWRLLTEETVDLAECEFVCLFLVNFL